MVLDLKPQEELVRVVVTVEDPTGLASQIQQAAAEYGTPDEADSASS